VFFFFSSRRRHTRLQGDWSSDVCSSDLRGESGGFLGQAILRTACATVGDFDHVDGAYAQCAPVPRGALAIALGNLTLGTAAEPADGSNDEPHDDAMSGSAGPFRRCPASPLAGRGRV